MRVSSCVITLIAAVVPFHVSAAQERSADLLVVRPADVAWQPAPPFLEPGAEGAVLLGDPSQAGPFTLRMRLPTNYRIAPHRHSVSERLTVLSGTLCFTTSDGGVAESDSTCIGAGAFRLMPAGTVHSDWTAEPVEYQIDGVGPFDLRYVNPEDDPRQREGTG